MMCEDIVERTETNERLKRNGWKVYTDTTLRQWKKKDLIDLIRCLEHNYSAMIERWERTSQNAEKQVKILQEKFDEKIELVEDDFRIKSRDSEIERLNKSIDVLKKALSDTSWVCDHCKHNEEVDEEGFDVCCNCVGEDLWELKIGLV